MLVAMKVPILLLALAGAALAQHNYTPADVEEGGRLYRSTCVGCHGQNGDLVGGVDLAHGKFKRASTDDGVIQIIRSGIPGTPMPPNNFTEFQAGTIVAYLRSLGGASTEAAAGDAARGKSIFEGKGNCASCHRVRGNGSRLGPDLSDIGTLRRPAELQRSLVQPDAEILPQNRFVRAVAKDGTIISGRILNSDTYSVQILDSAEHLRSLNKSDLREFAYENKSPMPSYQGRLNAQELADVVAYLGTLKGVEIR
jgi:putative heme-binding domain-containing protein